MKLSRIIPGIVLSLSLLVAACNNENTGTATESASKTDSSQLSTAPAVFDLLLGTWTRDDGKTFERWTKNENGTYTAVVFSLKGADTSWDEHVSIYPENEKWVYENTVARQNEGKAVKFVSSFMTPNSVQFSNPAHDFPTDINYTLPDANTVNAFIVGPNDKGGKDTIPFSFTRAK